MTAGTLNRSTTAFLKALSLLFTTKSVASSDDGYLADGSFLAISRGSLYHIDARSYAFSVSLVTAVPREGTSVGATFSNKSAIGRHYLHVGIVCKSRHGDKSCVIGAYRIGIGIDVVLRHLFSHGAGIAHERAKAAIGAEEHFARLVVDSDGLQRVAQQR